MGTTSDWSHETALSAEPVSALRARDFVCLHLVQHELPHLVDDLRLTVSELATNAMQHARTPFTVVLEQIGVAVLLTVRDASPDSLAPVGAADPHGLGGRGLAIVAFLSRDWGVTTGQDGTKSVWASFDIHAVGDADTRAPEPLP